jgi:hypothetical protein
MKWIGRTAADLPGIVKLNHYKTIRVNPLDPRYTALILASLRPVNETALFQYCSSWPQWR